MARTIARRSQGGTTNTTIATWVKEFLGLKGQINTLQSREKEVKDRLHKVVQTDGYTDDKGHQFFDLPEPIEGYSKLKRERRVKQDIDTEKVMALVERKRGKKDAIDKVIVMVPAVDEDALMAAYYRGDISDEEFQSLVTEKVNYAFKPVK